MKKYSVKASTNSKKKKVMAANIDDMSEEELEELGDELDVLYELQGDMQQIQNSLENFRWHTDDIMNENLPSILSNNVIELIEYVRSDIDEVLVKADDLENDIKDADQALDTFLEEYE